MEPTVDYPAIMAYVEKRRKQSGGFGATPRLPATIQDTFQAFGIIDDLGRIFPGMRQNGDEASAGFLAAKLALPWPGMLTFFQLLSLGHRFGLAADRDRVRRRFHEAAGADGPLIIAYCAVRLAAEVLKEPLQPLLDGLPEADLPIHHTLTDIAMYLVVRRRLDLPVDAPSLIDRVRRSQNGDGGFGFYPGTTSFIENCHAALTALNLLGAEPANPISLRRFLVSCQTGSGGFSRNPAAAPFLDATWHGVRCLTIMQLGKGR